jgi:uncharacterized protein YjbI with pentapeptide repeats
MKNVDQERGWPLRLIGLFEQPSFKISIPIGVLGIIFFVALIVIGFAAVAWLLVDLLSGDQKRAAEATKAALPILAGVIGLPLIIWRLLILDRQTKISEEKTQIDRETQYTSIFSRGIDQLGQTRELKSTANTNGTFETITRTVPNIEVRLGGIHSLIRLAEESRRDRAKIESTLLSYVRENSWLNRDGERSARTVSGEPSYLSITFSYRRGQIREETEKAYETWAAEFNSNADNEITWGNSLPETRVDVNEAIDAACGIDVGNETDRRRLFFESLFVGRQFTSELLKHVRFERCTFINCVFVTNHIQNLTIDNSTLSGCTFDTKTSTIEFVRCKIVDPFLDVTDSQFSFHDCKVSGLASINNRSVSIFRFHEGILHRAVLDEGPILVMAESTLLSDCSFDEVKFVEGSYLKRCAFPRSSFKSADLTHNEIAYPKALLAATGDESTELSEKTPRPSNWPDYSEDDVEESGP